MPRVFTEDDFADSSSGAPPPSAPPDALAGVTDPWQRFGETAIGGLSRLIPFNLGDEAVAGGSALADALLPSWLGGTGQGLSDAYDQRLNQVRNYEKAFSQQASGTGAEPLVDVGSALAIPGVNGLMEGATGIGQKTLAGAATGGLLNALYGLGGGEGAADRAVKAGEGGLAGEALGGVLGLTGGVLGSVGNRLSKYSEDVLPLSPEEKAIQDLNITRAQLSAAEKYSPSSPLEEPNLVQAINGAKERGVFTGISSPSEALVKNDAALEGLNQKATALLQGVDKSLTEPVVPEFSNSEAYVAKHAAEPNLLEQFQKRQALVTDMWDGSLGSLNKAKQAIGSVGYSGSATSTEKTLDRLITYDLKQSVLKGMASNASPEVAALYDGLNAAQAEHLSLIPTLEKARIGDVTRSINAGPAGIPFSGKNYKFGTGTGALVAALTGHPIGALAGAGLWTAQKAAETDMGRNIISALASGTGGASSGIGSLLAKAIIPASAILGSHAQSETQPPPVGTSVVRQLQHLSGNQVRSQLPSPQTFQPRVFNESDFAPTSSSKVSSMDDKSQALFKPTSAKDLIENQPPIIQAVIKTESSGNPNAVGPKTKYGYAKGLMQLLDSTAKDELKKMGKDPESWDPHDAKMNIEVGTHYLMKTLLPKYEGNLAYALAAYNFGPGNFDEYLKGEKQLPSETADYVKNIIGQNLPKTVEV